MTAQASINIGAEDVGKARAFLPHSDSTRPPLFVVDLGPGVSFGGDIGGAIAMRDALNNAIEQAEQLEHSRDTAGGAS